MALALADQPHHARCAVVVSLHQVDVAMRYCPRVVALRQGKVVYDGPSAALTPACCATCTAPRPTNCCTTSVPDEADTASAAGAGHGDDEPAPPPRLIAAASSHPVFAFPLYRRHLPLSTTTHPKRSHTALRRTFLAVVASGVAACPRTLRTPRPEHRLYLDGIVRPNLKTAWQPLIDDLSEALGVQVRPFFASDYAGIIEGMRFNKVQLGWFGNKSAIEADGPRQRRGVRVS